MWISPTQPRSDLLHCSYELSSKPCAASDPSLLYGVACGRALCSELRRPAGRPSDGHKNNPGRKREMMESCCLMGNAALTETVWHPAALTVTLETFNKHWISCYSGDFLQCVCVCVCVCIHVGKLQHRPWACVCVCVCVCVCPVSLYLFTLLCVPFASQRRG